ncbi:MAG: ABC transporter substrate-binding protein [Myxococcales bacterium]|nr:ABC transporter substrate-binding protein [Myxococcales bacterium]
MSFSIRPTLRRTVWWVAILMGLTSTVHAKASKAAKAKSQPATATKGDGAAAAAAVDPGSPLAFIRGVYEKLNTIAKSTSGKATLHSKIGAQMSQFMDYNALSQRTLGKKTWAGLSEAQKKQFIALLTEMVQKTFVKRFKPGTRVQITYNDKVRRKKDGRAQVRTQLKVKRTSASVYYSMIATQGQWRVYDITVDDVSQLQTYKRSFRKILKKEGWAELIKRMKKSAGK